MVTAVTPVPILEATPTNAPPAPPAQSASPSRETAAEPTLRLVIEEPSAGQFVYKTMDRLTGEVVRQFPREEVVRIMSAETYAPGAVADVEA